MSKKNSNNRKSRNHQPRITRATKPKSAKVPKKKDESLAEFCDRGECEGWLERDHSIDSVIIGLSDPGGIDTVNATARNGVESAVSIKPPREKHGDRELVYGHIFNGDKDDLIILRRSSAEKLAYEWDATRVKTWGEFKKLIPLKDYEELYYRIEQWVLAPVVAEVPDDEPLDREVVLIEGDWPVDSRTVMARALPRDIIEEFGSISPTVINDDIAELDIKREHSIIDALIAKGYQCVLDEALIARASGQEKAHEGPIVLSSETLASGIVLQTCRGLHLKFGFDEPSDAVAFPVKDRPSEDDLPQDNDSPEDDEDEEVIQ